MSTTSKRPCFFAHLDEACIPVTASIHDALAAINKSGALMSCITDETRKLIGVLTDSDIRKALLNGATISDKALDWANLSPKVVHVGLSTEAIVEISFDSEKRELPLVDDWGNLQDIFVLGIFDQRRDPHEAKDIPSYSVAAHDFPAFILAGGRGTRLRSAVPDRPKPLALVSDRSLISIVIENLYNSGFRKIFVSLNYMADEIETHLRQLTFQNLEFEFIREMKPLGTAGSIAYVKNTVKRPLLVCNADVLSALPLDRVLRYHLEAGADLTCVVRPHRISIPFGVVRTSGASITSLEEKPELSYMVNAGIYVINPDALTQIAEDSYLDMPVFVSGCIQSNLKVDAFFLHEYWLDVGRPEDYEKANRDYETIFGQSHVPELIAPNA